MRKQYAVLGVFLAIALFLFFFRNFPPVTTLSSGLQNLFSGSKQAIYGFKTALSGKDSDQIISLKKENADLVKKLINYQKTLRDNEALRSQFETAQTSAFKMVPAGIIGFLGRFNDPSGLVINVGSKNGIKRGMAVISGNNLIGKIDLVSDGYSRVVLLSNENFSEVAKTSEEGSLGVVHGQRDFILLSQVSIKDKITENEIVLTRGGENLENLVPAGLVIGKITSVYKNESMPYQTAKIAAGISILKLETVFVVTGF